PPASSTHPNMNRTGFSLRLQLGGDGTAGAVAGGGIRVAGPRGAAGPATGRADTGRPPVVGRRDGRAHGRRILRDLVPEMPARPRRRASPGGGPPVPPHHRRRRRGSAGRTGLLRTPSTAAWRGRADRSERQ